MRIVSHIVTGVVVALAVALIMLTLLSKAMQPLNHAAALKTLHGNSAIIEKKLDDCSDRIARQLNGFTAMVSEDRDFIMKLLVENDYTAPEVAEIAGQYIKAMGLSFLEITDENFRILSSGHFPAGAGSQALTKKDMPENKPVWMVENSKGNKVLSLQIKIPFSCEGVHLFCVGGILVDDSFLNTIRPFEECLLILKQGNEIRGFDSIQKMSEIKENKIIINDKPWLAASFTLPWVGQEDEPELILLLDEPAPFSLLDLL